VAAYDQIAGQPARDQVHILHGARLRRHPVQKRHVEVFLPAHECRIGTAERDICRFSVQYIADRRELLFNFHIELIDIVIHSDVAEARAAGQRDEQPLVLPGRAHMVEHFRKMLGPVRVLDAYGRL